MQQLKSLFLKPGASDEEGDKEKKTPSTKITDQLGVAKDVLTLKSKVITHARYARTNIEMFKLGETSNEEF